jgi:hypothetical protein
VAITANTGSNNWNTGAAWVGGVQPTAADDVIIPASAVVTIPTATTVLGRSLTVQASGTLAWASTTATLNLGDATAGAGSVAISISATATITLTGIGTINLVSTSATVQTIATGGKTMPLVRVNGAGSSYQLTSSYTTASFMSLTAGTLDTNGQTCSWANFDLGVGTKTLTLGASAITITGTGTSWSASINGAGFTINPGTSTITMTAANPAFAGNGKTYNNLVFTGSGTVTITGANSFNNVTATPAAAVYMTLAIASNQTCSGTITGTGVYSGVTAGRVLFCIAFAGSATPITLTAAAVSFTNVDFMDITAAGAAVPWTGTSMGDAGGNSNITFDTPKTMYWIGNGGSTGSIAKYSLTSGGATANATPLPQDDVVFDANSITLAAQTITHNLRVWGHNIDFTNVANNPTVTLGGFSPNTTGSLTLKSGMTCIQGSSSVWQFVTRGASTFNSAGNTLTWGLNFSAWGSSYTLQGDLAVNSPTNPTVINAGTFDANGYNLTLVQFSSSTTNTRSIIMGSGTWTITGTGTCWNMSSLTGLTFSGASATLLITDTSAATKLIEHRSSSPIGTCVISGGTGAVTLGGGAGVTTKYGTVTFTAPGTFKLPTGATTTTQITTLVLAGSLGNTIALSTSVGGTTGLLSLINPCTATYTTFTDINANPGASIDARSNCTDSGNNHNVIFATPNRLASAGVG